MRISAFPFLIAVLIAVMLAASPAVATPPQVVSVKERLIGMGGGFLFIERALNDNMGSHYLEQVDKVLIARDIETNQDTYVWPLTRSLDKGPDHVVSETEPRVVVMPLEVTNSAWQIIGDHHGRLSNVIKATEEDAVEMLSNGDGVLINIRTPHFAYEAPEGTPARTSYWVNYAKLSDVINDSLRSTRYAFPPHFVEGSDILIEPGFAPAQDCRFDYFAQLSEQTDGEQQAIWAGYVTCENDVTMAPVSMLLTLKKLP